MSPIHQIRIHLVKQDTTREHQAQPQWRARLKGLLHDTELGIEMASTALQARGV